MIQKLWKNWEKCKFNLDLWVIFVLIDFFNFYYSENLHLNRFLNWEVDFLISSTFDLFASSSYFWPSDALNGMFLSLNDILEKGICDLFIYLCFGNWGVNGYKFLLSFYEFLCVLFNKFWFVDRLLSFNTFDKFYWNWGLDFLTSYIMCTCSFWWF